MELQHVCRNWNLRVERDEYLWKLFFLEKVKPMSFVGIRAKRSRTFGNVFRQDCELCNICAQRQFFKQYFVFFSANRKSVRFNIMKKIVQRFLEIPPTCTEERLEGNEILKEK